MAWIDEIEPEDAEGELRDIYDELLEKRGKIANILKVHSLKPGALQAHLDLYMQVVFGRSKLSRGEREMIAVAVSRANNCDYCVNHHLEALARYEKDEARLTQLGIDYRKADLSERHFAMLDYVTRLTSQPSAVTETCVEHLREAGFSDRDILDMNLVAAYFNFVNRIALGLGVDFNENEIRGYRS